MRLNEISENHNMRLVKKRCSDILGIYSHCDYNKKSDYNRLYRGVDSPGSFDRILMTPENRKTKGIPQEISIEIDHLFKEHGLEAIRSNSIFCTGARNFAWGYAPVKIILPLNGFKFTWSSKIKDLFNIAIDAEDNFENLDAFIADFKAKWLPTYHVDRLSIAISTGNEIMVHGKYYLIDPNQYEELI